MMMDSLEKSKQKWGVRLAFLLAHGCLEKLGEFLPGPFEIVGFISVWPPLHAASAHVRRTEEFFAVAHLQ